MSNVARNFFTIDPFLETWRRTKSANHLNIALACSRIARERFEILQREGVATSNYRELILIERQAELDAVDDEVRATIAECREQFEQAGRKKEG